MEHMKRPELLTNNAPSENINQLTREYNSSAAEASKFGLHYVRQKEKRQIESKLTHLRSKKELVLLILEEQINASMNQLGKR